MTLRLLLLGGVIGACTGTADRVVYLVEPEPDGSAGSGASPEALCGEDPPLARLRTGTWCLADDVEVAYLDGPCPDDWTERGSSRGLTICTSSTGGPVLALGGAVDCPGGSTELGQADGAPVCQFPRGTGIAVLDATVQERCPAGFEVLYEGYDLFCTRDDGGWTVQLTADADGTPLGADGPCPLGGEAVEARVDELTGELLYVSCYLPGVPWHFPAEEIWDGDGWSAEGTPDAGGLSLVGYTGPYTVWAPEP